jgi:hypothetical protein
MVIDQMPEPVKTDGDTVILKARVRKKDVEAFIKLGWRRVTPGGEGKNPYYSEMLPGRATRFS